MKQVLGYIVIERPLVVAHGVFVQPATPLCKRTIKEFLSLTAKRSLEDNREAALKFVFLTRDQRSIVFSTEHLAKRSNIAEQRARWLHVLYETP